MIKNLIVSSSLIMQVLIPNGFVLNEAIQNETIEFEAISESPQLVPQNRPGWCITWNPPFMPPNHPCNIGRSATPQTPPPTTEPTQPSTASPTQPPTAGSTQPPITEPPNIDIEVDPLQQAHSFFSRVIGISDSIEETNIEIGRTLRYRITLSNQNNVEIQDFAISSRLNPDLLELVSDSVTINNQVVASSDYSFNSTTGELRIYLPVLAAGTSYEINFDANVLAGDSGNSIPLIARLYGPANESGNRNFLNQVAVAVDIASPRETGPGTGDPGATGPGTGNGSSNNAGSGNNNNLLPQTGATAVAGIALAGAGTSFIGAGTALLTKKNKD